MADKRLEPEEVLQDQLEYLNQTSVSLAHEIARKLKEEGQGLALAQLYHDAVATRKQLIDIANKLIPYRAPRLESVEVKSQVEHRYVVFSPEPIRTIDSFLNAVGKEKLDPIIVNNAPRQIDLRVDTPLQVAETPQEEPDEMYILEN